MEEIMRRVYSSALLLAIEIGLNYLRRFLAAAVTTSNSARMGTSSSIIMIVSVLIG
jgi:hypothetical protein